MAEALAKKLLLVGWDAADWELIHPLLDAGRMPNLKRVVESGVMGNLMTLQPILSPILWTSIATGKRAYHHGITGFVEPTPDGDCVATDLEQHAEMQSALEYFISGRQALSCCRLVCQSSGGDHQWHLRLTGISDSACIRNARQVAAATEQRATDGTCRLAR